MSSENIPGITPLQDGPYMVKGLKLCSSQKGPIEAKEKMALCRCGQSANKPFCDGAHWHNNFTDDKN